MIVRLIAFGWLPFWWITGLIAFLVNYQADCPFGWLPTTDCGFRKVANCRGRMRWGCHLVPIDQQRRAIEPLWFLLSASLVVQRQPNELPRTDWGRSCLRVDTTIKNTMHLPSKGCKKLSKRMTMQSNCNGSSWGPRAKKTMRVTGRGGRESGDKTNFVLLKFWNLLPRKE